MEYTAIQAFPSYIKPVVLQELLEEACAREALLQQIIRRLEQRHSCSLPLTGDPERDIEYVAARLNEFLTSHL